MSGLSETARELAATRTFMFTIALMIGAGTGLILRASPISLGALGTVSSIYIGGALVAAGVALYVARDRYVSTEDDAAGE